MSTQTPTLSPTVRKQLEELQKQGHIVPELDPTYRGPMNRERLGKIAVFNKIPADQIPAGYQQCARCGRLLSQHHFTKNKGACRDCNGLSSKASHARTRGLAFSPDTQDKALIAAHPSFPANPDKAREWAAKVEAEKKAKEAAAQGTESSG